MMALSRDAERRLAGAAAPLLLLAVLEGCVFSPFGLGPATDRYERCSAADARRALDAATGLIAEGRGQQALPLLRAAIAACPDRVRTHLLYQRTARSLGGEAAKQMRSFYLEETPDDGASPVVPFLRAELAADDATRLDGLRAALQRDARFYYADLALARMRRRLGQPGRALGPLRDALSARPTFEEARIELAGVLVELGRYREAERHYANYVRARPSDRNAAAAYAVLLIYKLGRPDRAAPLVRRMLEDDPDDADALMHLAAIAWKQGRLSEAVATYHRVLELDPSESRAVLNLANLYFEPLARGTEQQRRAAWAKARKAYLYFRNMGRSEDLYDALDLRLTVPFRLQRIAALLGPDDGRPPRQQDF